MKYKIYIWGKTDKGKVRQRNEDNLKFDETIGFMAVADGMGGHNNGELASKMATELTYEKFKELTVKNEKPEVINKDYSLAANRLINAFDYANSKIFEESLNNEKNKGMGTTLTACVFNDLKISLVHIGDSRAYILREGKMIQISEDDSFVMDQYKKGNITLEEAKKSSYRNVLTKALGVKPHNDYFVYESNLKPNDILILATDGLTKMLEDDEISKIAKKPENLCVISEELINKANEKGGEDNITVIIAKIESQSFIEKIKNLI